MGNPEYDGGARCSVKPRKGPILLATARDALLQEILPKLSGTDAFTARMIANAMAIAAREATQCWHLGGRNTHRHAATDGRD
jgi:hypothetical protein